MIGSPKEISQYLWQLDPNKEYEIKEHKNKRSLDANGYCWVLCKKIADKLHITKEEVYRKNIKEMGKYEVIPIRNEAVVEVSKYVLPKNCSKLLIDFYKVILSKYKEIIGDD